jgi:plastocyanin
MKRLLVLLALGLLLAGCAQQAQQSPPAQNSGGSGGSGGGGSGSSASVVIHIKNFAFDPAQATVKQGQTVEWINDDSVPHSIKAAGFTSPNIPQGGSFTHTFSESPGDYSYVCGIHPSMQGVVTVQ